MGVNTDFDSNIFVRDDSGSRYKCPVNVEDLWMIMDIQKSSLPGLKHI